MSSISESVSHQKFRSNIQYLNQHLQVIDASLMSTTRLLGAYKNQTHHIPKALGMNSTKYDVLNHPVKSYTRLFSYTRSKNAEFSIIELYNAFSLYMKSILHEMFKHDPLQIVGKASTQTLTYVDIIKFGSLEKLNEEMVNKVFRKLEELRSTTDLLDKILKNTDVEVPEALKATALMYLEMRHLFIHNDGKVDERFFKNYETILNTRVGNKLPTNFDMVSKAIGTVCNLVETIDRGLVDKGLVSKRH